MATFPSRHAISRARFFLDMAESCELNRRNEFEAFLEAAIVFGRSALHRVQAEFEGHPKWKAWFEALRENQSVQFFRVHRNFILKEGPPRIGQKIIFGEVVENAGDLYFFDEPDVTASETVRQHLDQLTCVVEEAMGLFCNDAA